VFEFSDELYSIRYTTKDFEDGGPKDDDGKDGGKPDEDGEDGDRDDQADGVEEDDLLGEELDDNMGKKTKRVVVKHTHPARAVVQEPLKQVGVAQNKLSLSSKLC
jgi:hypothetical protein